MFKRRLQAVLFLTVAVACCYHDPSFAMADEPVVPAAAVDIARAQWPGSQCAGHEQVTVVEDLTTFSGLKVADPSVIVAGFANWRNGACEVWVDSRMLVSDYLVCVVLAHEFGHLVSRNEQHALGDPSNIMSALLPTDYPPCYPLLPAEAPAPAPNPPAAPAPAAAPLPVQSSRARVTRKVRARKSTMKEH